MPSYNKGKIYKLVNTINDDIYVGSTIQSLPKRFKLHKYHATVFSYKLYAALNEVGWDNVKIELIEDYPCQNRKQLTQREYYHIQVLKPSLNTKLPKKQE